eukprot:TRINITY_DN60204_c0_g1_i1.p1 TRINITY_DN60204_c0_g1~~TRINITY_DN60204_c0_g1_i1.p1  ORF type:complete len:882 (+),score=118.20 TRINITY_DN60204_c0_g1_i1:51-2696(+)
MHKADKEPGMAARAKEIVSKDLVSIKFDIETSALSSSISGLAAQVTRNSNLLSQISLQMERMKDTEGLLTRQLKATDEQLQMFINMRMPFSGVDRRGSLSALRGYSYKDGELIEDDNTSSHSVPSDLPATPGSPSTRKDFEEAITQKHKGIMQRLENETQQMQNMFTSVQWLVVHLKAAFDTLGIIPDEIHEKSTGTLEERVNYVLSLPWCAKIQRLLDLHNERSKTIEKRVSKCEAVGNVSVHESVVMELSNAFLAHKDDSAMKWQSIIDSLSTLRKETSNLPGLKALEDSKANRFEVTEMGLAFSQEIQKLQDKVTFLQQTEAALQSDNSEFRLLLHNIASKAKGKGLKHAQATARALAVDVNSPNTTRQGTHFNSPGVASPSSGGIVDSPSLQAIAALHAAVPGSPATPGANSALGSPDHHDPQYTKPTAIVGSKGVVTKLRSSRRHAQNSTTAAAHAHAQQKLHQTGCMNYHLPQQQPHSQPHQNQNQQHNSPQITSPPTGSTTMSSPTAQSPPSATSMYNNNVINGFNSTVMSPPGSPLPPSQEGPWYAGAMSPQHTFEAFNMDSPGTPSASMGLAFETSGSNANLNDATNTTISSTGDNSHETQPPPAVTQIDVVRRNSCSLQVQVDAAEAGLMYASSMQTISHQTDGGAPSSTGHASGGGGDRSNSGTRRAPGSGGGGSARHVETGGKSAHHQPSPNTLTKQTQNNATLMVSQGSQHTSTPLDYQVPTSATHSSVDSRYHHGHTSGHHSSSSNNNRKSLWVDKTAPSSSKHSSSRQHKGKGHSKHHKHKHGSKGKSKPHKSSNNSKPAIEGVALEPQERPDGAVESDEQDEVASAGGQSDASAASEKEDAARLTVKEEAGLLHALLQTLDQPVQ